MDIKVGEVWLNEVGDRHLVIYTKAKGDYPVITFINGESTRQRIFTAKASFRRDGDNPELNLVRKAQPYDDWEIDKKVVSKTCRLNVWLNNHWAGINEGGNPSVWTDGKTSHTSSVRIEVAEVSPVEDEA